MMQRYSQRFAPMQLTVQCSISRHGDQGQPPYHQRSCLKEPKDSPKEVWGAMPGNLLSRGSQWSSEHALRNTGTVTITRPCDGSSKGPGRRCGESTEQGQMRRSSQGTSILTWLFLGEWYWEWDQFRDLPSKKSANFNHDCHWAPSRWLNMSLDHRWHTFWPRLWFPDSFWEGTIICPDADPVKGRWRRKEKVTVRSLGWKKL